MIVHVFPDLQREAVGLRVAVQVVPAHVGYACNLVQDSGRHSRRDVRVADDCGSVAGRRYRCRLEERATLGRSDSKVGLNGLDEVAAVDVDSVADRLYGCVSGDARRAGASLDSGGCHDCRRRATLGFASSGVAHDGEGRRAAMGESGRLHVFQRLDAGGESMHSLGVDAGGLGGHARVLRSVSANAPAVIHLVVPLPMSTLNWTLGIHCPVTMSPRLVLASASRRKIAASISAADLFCGVGGLTRGLESAGIRVGLGIDIDPACEYPYAANNGADFLLKSVEDVTAAELSDIFDDARFKLLAHV